MWGNLGSHVDFTLCLILQRDKMTSDTVELKHEVTVKSLPWLKVITEIPNFVLFLAWENWLYSRFLTACVAGTRLKIYNLVPDSGPENVPERRTCTSEQLKSTKIKLHWLGTWIHGLHNNFISLPYCKLVHFFWIDPNLFFLRVYLVGSFSLWEWEGSKYDTKKSLVQHSMNQFFLKKTLRL